MNYSDLKIEWCGEILAEVGYGVQARNILKPLIDGGADIKVIPAEDYIPESRKIKDPYWLKVIEDSKTKDERNVRVNFSILPQQRLKPGAINVGFMQWETNCIPVEWVPFANNLNYLIASSDFGEHAYRVAGVNTNIKIMRPNISVPSDNLVATSINEIPPGTVKFLFSGNWVPRKNHADLITAFSCAFAKLPDVALIIKCWPMGEDTNSKRNIEAGIRHFCDRLRGVQRPRICLLTDFVTLDKSDELIKSCDVYVSASKAEGFDSAAITAMAMEKIVIGVPYGFKYLYTNPQTSLPVDYSAEPIVESAVPGYDAYQAWARPNVQSLISQMHTAYRLIKDPTSTVSTVVPLTGKQLGANARSKVLELFSPEVNTPNIYKVLKEIVNESSSPAKGIKAAPKVVPATA